MSNNNLLTSNTVNTNINECKEYKEKMMSKVFFFICVTVNQCLNKGKIELLFFKKMLCILFLIVPYNQYTTLKYLGKQNFFLNLYSSYFSQFKHCREHIQCNKG
jgi:hypothetical protein